MFPGSSGSAPALRPHYTTTSSLAVQLHGSTTSRLPQGNLSFSIKYRLFENPPVTRNTVGMIPHVCLLISVMIFVITRSKASWKSVRCSWKVWYCPPTPLIFVVVMSSSSFPNLNLASSSAMRTCRSNLCGSRPSAARAFSYQSIHLAQG